MCGHPDCVECNTVPVCNHIVEISSIYDGGICLNQKDGSEIDIAYATYKCEYCPRCGVKL